MLSEPFNLFKPIHNRERQKQKKKQKIISVLNELIIFFTSSHISSTADRQKFCFEATGSVAHSRIAPLLPTDWIDVTSTSYHRATQLS